LFSCTGLATTNVCILDFTGSFLKQNAVANEELHSQVRDEQLWTRLWEMSEGFIGEKYSL
jgi:hypothetical protein